MFAVVNYYCAIFLKNRIVNASLHLLCFLEVAGFLWSRLVPAKFLLIVLLGLLFPKNGQRILLVPSSFRLLSQYF